MDRIALDIEPLKGIQRHSEHESAVDRDAMRSWRMITWARLRVYFGTLLLALFALGGGLIYASYVANPESGHGRSDLRALGLELMALSGIAAVCSAVLKERLSRDGEMRDR